MVLVNSIVELMVMVQYSNVPPILIASAVGNRKLIIPPEPALRVVTQSRKVPAPESARLVTYKVWVAQEVEKNANRKTKAKNILRTGNDFTGEIVALNN